MIPHSVFCQGIGIGTTSPDASAALDVTTKSAPYPAQGLLIPRMTSAGITAIVKPAKGLKVYDSVKNLLMVNKGTAQIPNWQTIAGNTGWHLTGNSGTDTAHNFIGTTDSVTFFFNVNSRAAGLLDLKGKNAAFGYEAIAEFPSSNNSAMGYETVAFGGVDNTGNGVLALSTGINAEDNTAIGYSALQQNTRGMENVAFGWGGSLYKFICV